jgi:RNA polymerase sigma factor (TIGR02999 family)
VTVVRHDVTTLLIDWSNGDRNALEALLPAVYEELRAVAARQLRSERSGHTLQPTALVHEAYLRLVDQREANWQSRAHFFGVAAQVMRRILVDHARRRNADKRGGGIERVSLDEEADRVESATEVSVTLCDDLLNRLSAVDCRLAQIAELRVFGGLTVEQAAHVLDVSVSTAKRDWRTAKAWLARELGSEASL